MAAISRTSGCTRWSAADARSYAALNPTFPHESTADQWFSESQMESYRVLGSYIVDLICSGTGALERGLLDPCSATDQPLDLPRLFAEAQVYLQAYSQPAQPAAS